ncbi:MAG TPA: peptide chain release factor N(5)-glutamine methyltransferase [Fimbriimonas sp.]
MTVQEWLREAEARLEAAGVESPKLEAQLLAGHVLGVDRTWLFANGGREFPEMAGEAILQRREGREPLAYILGYREFYGRRFAVDRRVLIPRHETETLVEKGLRIGGRRVLDLGTGSGILAVTTKLERPEAEVVASDVSAEALAVARLNADRLGADIRFVLSDGFIGLLGEAFDLILTNPPYIGREEPLMPEVRDHEPHAALFAGATGMEFYEMLASQAQEHLLDEGVLLMEVGYRQAEAVAALFRRQGWQVPAIHPDLAGVGRVVEARYPYACAS